jgi:hypothetical protein
MAGEMGLHCPTPRYEAPIAAGASASVPRTRKAASALDPHGRRP